MKSCHIIILPLLVLSFTGCAQKRLIEALQASQQTSEQRILAQEEQLATQRQQISYLEERNLDLADALFDLQQEIENLKFSQKHQSSQAKSISPKPSQATSEKPAMQEPQVDESGKVILGTVEWVWFDVMGGSVEAQLDDKLRSSSIYASNIQLFERDGDQWVRFQLAPASSEDTGAGPYESPLMRKVRVRPANGDDPESRPIVRLKVKLGTLIEDTEFTLVDRDTAESPVVLGRSFLRDIAVVDEKRQHTQRKHSENSSL